MDFTTPLTVVGGASVFLIIILTGLCLNCKGSSERKYIRQQPSYEPRNSYPSAFSGFKIVRPNAEGAHIITPTPQLMTSPIADPRRPSPCPSSDGGSQSDYINQKPEQDQSSYEEPPEKNDDYIVVLPDDQIAPQGKVDNSSLNSVDNYQNLEDFEEDDDEDDYSDSRNYININEDKEHIRTPVGSYASCSSDGQGSSDYVNAPKQVNVHFD